MKRTISNLLCIALCSLALLSCRTEEPTLPSETVEVNPWEQVSGDIRGFFLLNEGTMGSNNASLDYYDYSTGNYLRNIYPERNTGQAKELGDVGNDLKIYGNRLYAVINCSNYLEVMDAGTAVHIGRVTVPNCRYVVFKERYAYVSSYAGPNEGNESRLGNVVRIDTATLKITGTCTVGYQPEEMAVVDDRLYVVNSGGYDPGIERSVSIIDLESFTEVKKIPVAANLHRIEPDTRGNLWVSSRTTTDADGKETPSQLFMIEGATGEVTPYSLSCSNLARRGEQLYIYSSEWSWPANDFLIDYALIDASTGTIQDRSFIGEDDAGSVMLPYGIAVHPVTGDVLIADARNFIGSGVLHCLDSQGNLKWKVSTGNIPSCIAFTTKELRAPES